mgnify:FL=1
MDQKWADVVQRIGIRKAVGRQPKKNNGGQSVIVKLALLASIVLKDVNNTYPKSKNTSWQRS